MKVTVDIGKGYALRSEMGGEVTNAKTGKPLETLAPNKQIHMTAQEPEWNVPDDCAVTKVGFKYAPIAFGGGGSTNADGLPAGFTRIEYLESTGTQYIDTGIKPSAAHGLKIDHELTNDLDTIPLGCRNNGSSDTRFYALRAPRMSTNGSYLGYGWGAWNALTPNAEGRRVNSELNWLNSGLAAWQGATKALSALTFAPSRSLYMFAANVGGSASLLCSCRVWSAAISQNNSVVANFIPAIDTTGQPCMYDLISKQAYPNKGSGAFIAGLTGLTALANVMINLPHRETAGSVLNVRLPENVNMTEVRRICDLAGTYKNWQIAVI